MTVIDLLAELRRLDVNLRVDGDRLRFDAPPGAMTDQLRTTLKDRKDEILDWMRGAIALSADAVAIPRVAGEGPRPVSFAQRRMWFLQQLTPGSPLYHLAGAVRLSGRLDEAALQESLLAIQRRHEVLRTTFELRGDEPVQRVGPVVRQHGTPLDLSTLADDARAEALRDLTRRWVDQPFDLEVGPLFRARVVQSGPAEHVLLLAFHHIVFDGWSIGVFVRELAALYEAFSAGRPSPLAELPVQYGDYAAWQRQWMTDAAVARQLAYWRRQLAGPLPVLALPTDRPRPEVRTAGGALLPFTVPATVTEACERLAARHHTTLSMVLLAGFEVLLFRHTAQTDIVVGLPSSGRSRPELEPLMGLFVNSLALRVRLSGAMTFDALVERVRDVCFEALDHQEVPFERIVEDVRPERDTRHTPIFQVMFNPLDGGGSELRLPGLTVSPMEVQAGTSRVDLTLSVRPSEGRAIGLFEYSTDLFDRTTIERLAGHLLSILETAVGTPGVRLDEVSMLSPEATRAMGDLSRGRATDVHALHLVPAQVAVQIERRSQAVAVSDAAEALTYAQLDTRAAHLAARLRSRGVARETRVGVLLDRGVDLIVALWGVMRAGGAYVPLDPAYPDARLAFMADDARLSAVVTSAALAARGAGLGVPTVLVRDAVGAAESVDGPATVAPAVEAGDLAYIVYTSGSTGTPKGVEVSHAALANLVRWHVRAFELTADDVATQVASVGFDACGWEVWPSLAAGARLAVADNETRTDPDRFWSWLARERATVAFAPTPLAEEALRRPVPAGLALRTLLTGGDRLTARPPAGWSAQLVNNYGPTENAVVSTSGVAGVSDGGGRAPSIGRPIDHVQAYVLDDAMNEVPPGVVGELYVGGASLARGYTGRPALTAAAFVPDPCSLTRGGRLYRTRDLARWRDDGTLDFVGRRDGQIKLRGYRIELGEVEAALARAPGVRAAAAALHGDDERRRIVGYVVPGADGAFDRTRLQQALEDWLPSYMVPGAIVEVAALPLTTNGKVDRSALPAPPDARRGAGARRSTSRSGLESTIADIWSRVLGVADVWPEDSFFELGGHSLLLARVRVELETVLGRPVPLVTLFQYPTVGGLAAHLAAAVGGVGVASAAAIDLRQARSASVNEPIAVIGRAGRFPGASDVTALWTAAREGRELLKRFTNQELVHAGVPARLREDARYVPVRGVLSDVDLFDAGLFGVTPRDAALLDPQQRVLLECAWTALEDAGYGPRTSRPERIGIWAGTSANTYLSRISRSVLADAGPAQVLVASDKDFLATRVSYKLDLGGPAMTVQTACSTSLVAVHVACQALRAGECEVALAGGVSITVPEGGYVYQPEGIASPDGHCRPFDAAAQGTVAGNGVGVVVLKPLRAAVRDGDAIHAVIRGSAINNDGADKVGFTAPSVHGQAAVVRAAQAAAGVTPETVGYVEAHGTGTTLGDPIEVAALREVWGDGAGPGTCGLSSVKGIIGHLDAAAGIAGLLTAIEAVRAGEVPATAHFTRLNPDLNPGPFVVSSIPTPWPVRETARRAGVSSFGIGGTNAHVVIEEAPAITVATVPATAAPAAITGALGAWHVVPVSGQNAAAVAAAATQLADDLIADPTRALGDVAWTQQVGRAALGVRRVAIGTDATTVAAALRTARDSVVTARPPVVFVCPGQGTQVLRMGAALYETAPVFRAELDACAAVVQPLLGGDLCAILYPEAFAEADAGAQLGTTAWTQVALVAVGLALAAQWRAWGVTPDAVVGHSVGELTAACVAGVMSREATLTLAATRGQVMGAAPAGGMLAVLADVTTVTSHLGEDLWLAALNRPNQVVVAGAEPALARAEGAFEAAGIATQRLEAAGAFHSGLMAGAVAPLDAVAQALPHAAPRLPWISTVTGAAISADDAVAGTTCDATYWGRQVLAPVQWAAAVQTAASIVGGPAVWLELGPGTTLTRLVRGTVPVAATVPSLDGPDAAASVAQALGALWTAGVTPAWAAVHAPATPRRIQLPTYPFQRQRYWLEAVASDQDGQDVSKLFVKKSAVDDWFYRPSWRQAVPLAVPSADLPSQRWVVFADTTGLADHLSVRLVRAGQQVIVVEPGDRYDVMVDVAAQPTRFVIRPDVSADYDAMFDRLDMARAGVVTIVHAWSLGPSRQADGDRLGMEQVARARGFSSVRLLARALGRVPLERVRVNVVSTGVYAVTGDEDLVAVNATVVGPVRAMGAEIPRVSSRQIDVTWPTEPAARRAATERLVAELTDVDGPAVVAHRGAHRWVPSFEPVVAQREDVGASRLRQRGVYVITGGLGGVGLVLAEVLARLVQARLVLVGRSGLPAHRQEAVRALEALGADVMVMAADVASPDAMRSVFEQARARFGAINGVIHAAGVAGDGMMAIKNADAAGAVLAPKVTGTIVLDDLLGAERPDFVVLCSSLAAFLGGAGQADYCAANAFLDAYAQRRWCLGDDSVTSINWDTWRDGGMAVDTPVPGDVEWRKALALESGITNDEGQAVFLRALGMRLPQVVVCTKDLPRLVAAMAYPVVAGARPKDVATAVSHPRPALTTRFVAPERDSERQVCAAFERALGVAGIGVHDNFFELGGHSLLAVDLMAQLNRQFDANVPVAGLYEGLTPGAVAQLFDGQVASGPRQDIGAGRRKDRTRRQPDPRVRESRIERRQRG